MPGRWNTVSDDCRPLVSVTHTTTCIRRLHEVEDHSSWKLEHSIDKDLSFAFQDWCSSISSRNLILWLTTATHTKNINNSNFIIVSFLWTNVRLLKGIKGSRNKFSPSSGFLLRWTIRFLPRVLHLRANVTCLSTLSRAFTFLFFLRQILILCVGPWTRGHVHIWRKYFFSSSAFHF